MEVIKFIVVSIIGFIIGCFPILSAIIIFRVGIKNCNKILKDNNNMKEIVKFQRKRYICSLIYQIVIIIIISFCIFKFMYSQFFTYLWVIFLTVVANIKNTKNTDSNLEEFEQNLYKTTQIYNKKYKKDAIDYEKYIYLSKIVMQALETSNINETLNKVYEFYKENDIDINNIEYISNNPYYILAEIMMKALGTSNIDETINKTIEFYKNQGMNIE